MFSRMGKIRDGIVPQFFFSRSHLSRGTTMRDSPAKICRGLACPTDFCPGLMGHKKRLMGQKVANEHFNRMSLKMRNFRPSDKVEIEKLTPYFRVFFEKVKVCIG